MICLAFLAGHETTALTLSWIWWRIDANPQVKQKLYEELMAIAERSAMHLNQPGKSTDHGDLLYDEMGLPK